MPYCPSCGEEVEKGTVFCPSCGARIESGRREQEYVKPREKNWTWILAVVVGGIIVLAGVGMLIGGTGILWAERNLSDDKGFLTSGAFNLESDKHAIVLKGGEIELDFDLPNQIAMSRDWATIKIVGESNTDSPIFIGIAEATEAIGYLSGKNYDEVAEFDWRWNPVRRTTPIVSYKPHIGLPPDAPATVNWVTSVSGPGKETLEWDLEEGSYWVVLMNADASSNVDIDVEIGVKSPLLGALTRVLIIGGVIGILFGGGIIYLWVSRRR